MFKHKTSDGKRNISGDKIKELRKKLSSNTSQRMLAEMMQLKGIDIDKSAIKCMENGSRYITDIELKAFCSIFSVSADYLLDI
jgi:transcriptional regulator with XRE-family HTH domain